MGIILRNALILVFGFTYLEASPWLVGCYYGNDQTGGLVDAALLTSGSCVRSCQFRGSEFTVWKKPECFCLNQLPYDLRECSLSWRDDDDESGEETYRAFWMRAPRLSDADLLLPPSPVDVDGKVALRARVRVTDSANGFGGKLAIEFWWRTESASYVDRLYVPANRNATTLQSLWVTSFPVGGAHEISVRLLNGARTVSLKSWLTARPPIPGDLRLTLRTPTTPNCIPTHLCHSATAVVFAHQPALLEAFHPDLSDTTWRWTLATHHGQQVALEPASTGSTREITFQSEGCFYVQVEATTPEGTVKQKELNVACVERRIQKLNFTLESTTRHSTYSPGHQLTFIVSFISTTPQEVHTEIHFGDNTSLALSSYELSLEDDVAGGCQVFVHIHHVYESEGEFFPEVRVSSTTEDLLEAVLPDCVRVYEPLKDITIESNEAYAVGEDIVLTASLSRKSKYITRYNWELYYAAESLTLFSETSETDSFWKPTLNLTGRYVVRVAVFNPADNGSTEKEFVAQEPIVDLQIKPSEKTRAVIVGQTRHFNARYETGTNVTCQWSLLPSCRTCLMVNRSCRTRVTFDQPGRWSLSVEARNSLGSERTQLRLDVQEEIQDAHVATEPFDGVVVAGGTLTVWTAVVKGTDVTVKIRLGGLTEVMSKWDKERQLFVAREIVIRIPVGMMNVTVDVFNRVSRQNRTVNVVVTKRMRHVRVKHLGCVAAGVPAVFSAKTKDSERGGDLYIWKIRKGQSLVTSVPYAFLTFPIPGLTSMKLIVRRGAQERRIGTRIFVNDSCPVQLLHDHVVEVGKNVTFVLTGVSSDTTLKVIYGRNPKVHRLKGSVDTPHLTWQHMFSSPSVVKVTAERNNIRIVSVVQVELSPRAVTLSGPRLLHIWRFPVCATWEVRVKPKPMAGLVFQWSIGQFTYLSASPKFTTLVNGSGKHEVRVKVFNHLGHATSKLTVLVLPFISSVTLKAKPACINQSSIIILQIYGEPKFNISLDFGDNTSSRGLTFDLIRVKRGFYESVLSHRYLQADHYKVWVNVSNGINWLPSSTVAAVEDPIVNATLQLLSPSLVALFQEITVKATVGGGSWPEYLWDFGDGSEGDYTDVVIENNGSTARHSYGMAGTYYVKLVVKNAVNSLHLDIPVPIKAVEPIEGLRLICAEPYIAALSGIEPRTPLIQFEAHIWRGSDVEFIFDYGDGSRESVLATLDMRSIAMAIGKHVYKQKGVYFVKATAQNPLGSFETSLGQPFYVQFPPGNLSFIHPYFVTRSRRPVDLKIFVSQGTNVYFQWWLDGKLYKNHSDAQLTSTFHAPGMYVMKVRAYNLVTPLKNGPEAVTRIYVQEPLTDVVMNLVLPNNLTVGEGMNVDLATDEIVVFEVKVFPEMQFDVRFVWNLGEGSVRRTISSRLEHAFKHPGEHFVSVTAQNHISEMSSGTISLKLIQEIGNRTSIQHPGTVILGNEVHFRVLYSEGSDLNFTWSFGDGSSLKISSLNGVKHTFTDLGEFWVTVNIKNAFSDITVKSNIFILEQPCDKPQLSLIVGQSGVEVVFSDPFVVEVDLSTSCTLTSEVDFSWSITPLPDSVAEYLLRQRDLILGSRSLPVGRYTLSLNVSMSGTIVYETASTDLIVRYDHPVVQLNGGIQRTVGLNSTVFISSTVSEIQNDFIYEWACLGMNDHPCFPHGNAPHEIYRDGAENFSFPAKSLYHGGAEFILTIVDGLDKHSASQIVEIHPLRTSSISVECLNCKNNVVNGNQKLIFEALCTDCDPATEYQWKLYLIQDGRHLSSASDYYHYECVKDDGSISYLLESNDAVTPYEASQVIRPEKTNDGGRHGFSEVEFTTLPGFLKTTSAVTYINSSTKFPFLIEESDVYKLTGMDAFPEFSDGEEPFHVKEEGIPGEAGSASARGQVVHTPERNSDIAEASSAGRHDGSPIVTTTQSSSRHPLRNDISIHDVVSRIINRPRVVVQLDRNQTSTGLNSQHLVIRGGVLKPGSSYLAEVSTSDGTAMEYVQVLRGPTKGRCHVKPSSGTELSTVFRLHCLEWKSDHLPLRYSLTYSLHSHSFVQHTIYKGMNANAKFILPAGLKNNNNTVFLKVVVEDAAGATTHVCVVKCEVHSLNESQASFMDIFNLTAISRLTKLTAERNDQAIFHNVHVLASALLQHKSINCRAFQSVLMSYLITLRGRILPIQAMSALQAVLHLPIPMKSDELNAAIEFVASVAQKCSDEDDVLNTCLPTVSFLMWKTAQTFSSYEIKRLMSIIHHIKSVYLQKLVVSEGPTTVSTFKLDVSVGYINQLPLKINSCLVNVTLRRTSRLGKAIYLDKPQPVSLEAYSYDIFQSYVTSNIQTVVDLNVTDANFSSSLIMDVHFKKNLSEEIFSRKTFELNNNFANVHRLNVSGDMYVSVLVRFLDGDARLRAPLQINVGNSGSRLFLQTYVSGETKAHLLIRPDHIQGSGLIDITLHCEQNKCHRKDVWTRRYQMYIWEHRCVYRQDERWIQNICVTDENGSTEDTIICRCPCTGTAGIEVQSIRHHVTTISLDDIYGLEYQSSAIILLVLLGVVYFILFPWCYKTDIRNTFKPALISLEDNRACEMQNYIVTVQTGSYWDAGTTSAVFMVLHGNQGLSAAKCLTGQVPHHYLKRSSVEHFLFSTSASLGELWKLQVWHNNAGSTPSWHLKSVVVSDPVNGKDWKFDCNQWLAVEERDGQIEREFLVSELPQQRWSFDAILSCICEFHLWSSVLLAPSNSSLSHSQRLTCCLITATLTASVTALAVAFSIFKFPSMLNVNGMPWQVWATSALVSGSVFGAVTLLSMLLRQISPATPQCHCPAGIRDRTSCPWPSVQCPLPQKATSGSSNSLPSDSFVSLDDESSYYSAEESEDANSVGELELEEPLSHWYQIENWARSKYQQHSGYHQNLSASANTLEEAECIQTVNEEKGSTWCHSAISYFVWIIMFAGMGFLATVTMFVTKRFNEIEVLYWLESFVLSIVCDIFVLHPFLVLCTVAIKTPTTARIPSLTNVSKLNVNDSSDPLPYYRPPSEKYLIQERSKALRMQLAMGIFKHCLLSMVITIFLGLMVYGQTTDILYAQRLAVKNALSRPQIKNMLSVGELERWIKAHFQQTDYLKATGSLRIAGPLLYICPNSVCPNMGIEILNSNLSAMWPNKTEREFAVSLQFLLLNPTFYLFTYVSISTDFPNGETTAPLIQCFTPIPLRSFQGKHLVEVLLIFASLWMLKTEIWRLVKSGWQYFYNFWNCIQLIFIAVVLVHQYFTVHHHNLATNILRHHQETGNWDSMADFQLIANFDWVIRGLQGMLLFLNLCSWLRVFEVNAQIGQAIAVIKQSFQELFALWVLWLIVLFGYVLNRILSGQDENIASCLSRNKICLRTPEYSILTLPIQLVAIMLFFVTFALMRATLNTSRRKRETDSSSLTVTEIYSLVKERLQSQFGWSFSITNEQKGFLEVKPADTNHRPLEFILFDLDSKTDKLMQAAENLFAFKDSDFMSQLEIPVILTSENTIGPEESVSFCGNKSASLTTKSPHAICNRVRKTCPLRIHDSISLTSSEEIGVLSHSALRKTKSRGKGKNEDLQLDSSA